MNKDIVVLDLFSGIGGFSKGLTDADFNITKHYFSEIDKHAIAIYKYQFKNSEYVGSVTTLDGRAITRPNIITFGSPCQDFSVAGKRAGMEGQRSSLIGEALRLIAECRPDVFIWENVKGVFSSNNGADFWAIIQAFANIGGYRIEWQLLNTAWFLPQNRERIYLIGHLATNRGDWQGVFPITDNNRQVAQSIGRTQSLIVDTNYLERDCRIYDKDAPTLNSRDYKDPKIVMVGDYRQDEGFRWRKDGIAPTVCGSSKKSGTPNCSIIKVGNVGNGHEVDNIHDENGIAPTFRENHGKVTIVSQDIKRIGGLYNQTTRWGVYDDSGISPTITSAIGEGGGHVPMTVANTVTPDAYLARGERNRDENGKAVLTSIHDRRIRRLTEVECERLQGFSDGWTEYGDYDGEIKKVAKTQRYKCLGNAVTCRVVEEIGKRLLNT